MVGRGRERKNRYLEVPTIQLQEHFFAPSFQAISDWKRHNQERLKEDGNEGDSEEVSEGDKEGRRQLEREDCAS